ncbi:MAG: type II secretion system F family protein [Candidatus Daviesbacteria bacterium]|nr:type II secretion system F family protein [Candidatus Daviesbacteria bacterium]
MAEFLYKAKDIQGSDHSGSVDSTDAHSAAAMIRKKGLIIISLNPKKTLMNNFFDRFFNKVSFTELVLVTRQLATMVSSGLVLSEAIDILEEQQTNKILKKALEGISQDIKGGLTLAQALGKFPNIFPHLFINLVKSGEASGKLDSVLLQMAEGLEKDREFQARIKGAMIYPAVVVTMMIVVMIIMMIFVIPKLTSLYSQSTIDLPLPTKILIGTSNLFSSFWWVGIITVIGAVVGISRWKKTPQGDLFISKFILRIPIVGKIVTNVTLTNFNRTFGLLTSAGIPLLNSIGIVSDLTDNLVFKNALKDAYSGVEKGLPFSSLLSGSVFPKIVSQMVRVGEETGKVDEIFFKLADYFESESDHMVKNLTVAIEPIVLIVLGVGVGFLVISIILPIYKLTTSF